jgi:hypothetical protein
MSCLEMHSIINLVRKLISVLFVYENIFISPTPILRKLRFIFLEFVYCKQVRMF